MSIASVVEKGSTIYAYDEKGRTLFTRGKGNGPKDGLVGFTSSTVTVRVGATLYTLNEKGGTLFTKGG